MTTIPGLSDDDGKMLVADTLRLFVGNQRRMSWADLAAATGDDERKLRSYVEASPSAMPMPVFLRVFAVLPPEAFGRVCGRMGFVGPARLDVQPDTTLRRVMAEASRLVADGNEALEDGVISPPERAKLAMKAEALIPTLSALANHSTH